MARGRSDGEITPPLFIGVDGGGTGCRARLEDAAGRVLGAGFSGPAHLRLGIAASMASVESACRAALAEADLPAERLARIQAGIGLAGIGRKGMAEALRSWPHPFASAVFASDVKIACIGANGAKDGGIVIIGTGSCGL